MTTIPVHRLARVLLLAVIVLAFWLRLPAPVQPLPGLYHDEAYNGLDAAAVLDGHLQIYFPANNGREPLFIYLVSAFVAFLGRTPAALRLSAAFVGTALVAAAYSLGSMLFHRRHGLLAAALVAVAPWPVILGRVGLRAGTLPLVLALAVVATTRGVRRREERWVVAGGALAGLTLYTYAAARIVPLLAIAFAVWVVLRWRRSSAGDRRGIGQVAPHPPTPSPQRGEGEREGGRISDGRSGLIHDGRSWASRWAGRWLAAALIVALPLLIAFATAPGETLGRLGQVSVLGPAGRDGPLPHALTSNARGTLRMFVQQGDFIPRHNIPLRPILGTLAGRLAVLGALVALWRARRGWAEALLLLWLAVMCLPTLLAENAPHFLRAVGILPAVMLLPALGIEALAAAIGRVGTIVRTRTMGQIRSTERVRSIGQPRTTGPIDRAPGAAGAAVWLGLSVAIVASELVATVRYDGTPPGGSVATVLYYAFETGATELASDVNSVLGDGWQSGWAVNADARGQPVPSAAADARGQPVQKVDSNSRGQPVWLDRRLRDGWAAVPYLAPEARLTLVDPYDPILTTVPGVAFLWPLDLVPDRLWSGLPPNVRLSFRLGSLERGDLENEPRRLYVRVSAEPVIDQTEPVAVFANGMTLWRPRIVVTDDRPAVLVETEWGIEAPIDEEVTAFFQVLETDRLLVGSDTPLGSGLFNVPRWRHGDRVVEQRLLPLPQPYDPASQQVIAGLYTHSPTERVPVVDTNGTAIADHVTLEPEP